MLSRWFHRSLDNHSNESLTRCDSIRYEWIEDAFKKTFWQLQATFCERTLLWWRRNENNKKNEDETPAKWNHERFELITHEYRRIMSHVCGHQRARIVFAIERERDEHTPSKQKEEIDDYLTHSTSKSSATATSLMLSLFFFGRLDINEANSVTQNSNFSLFVFFSFSLCFSNRFLVNGVFVFVLFIEYFSPSISIYSYYLYLWDVAKNKI